MNRLAKILALGGPLVAAALLHAGPADACGGCFAPPETNTVVNAHRMALSVSMNRTVLWDQIQYQGNPEDFSWVLPIKPGARIETATSEWFDALEGSTATVISPPMLNCGGGGETFGCGSAQVFAGAAEDGSGTDHSVNVVKSETVGPYDSVTLSSKDAGALTGWLESHGYDIPDDVSPVIDAYVKEGFDFIALRLTPGNGVNLMTPVRVITDGASPVLPLRMVAAGTGPFTSIVLYVIGEGRWETANFPITVVPMQNVSWDGDKNSSNYAEVRDATLGLVGGNMWITSYALGNAFFGYDDNGDDEGYATGDIANTYFNQILDDNGANYQTYEACQNKISGFYDESRIVVDTCDPDTMTCGEATADQIDARDLACEKLDDLSVALVGMHPKDVWVSRLEANLPRFALNADLELRAAKDQSIVHNYHNIEKSTNYECPAAPVLDLPRSKDGKGSSGNGTALVVVGLGAVAALLAMRRSRFIRA